MISYQSLANTSSLGLLKRLLTRARIAIIKGSLLAQEGALLRMCTRKSTKSLTRPFLGRARTTKSHLQSVRTKIYPSRCCHAYQKKTRLGLRESKIRAQAPTKTMKCYQVAADTSFQRLKMRACLSLRNRLEEWVLIGSLDRPSHVMYLDLGLTHREISLSLIDLRSLMT